MFRISDSKNKWNPDKYQCLECATIIFSAYPGMFSKCICGKCFVDQTEYYTRIGGKPELIQEGQKNE